MKKFEEGGITAIDVYGDPASTGADPFGGFVSRPGVYIGDVGGLSLTEAEEEANLRAEIAAKEEEERELLEAVAAAQADLDNAIQARPQDMYDPARKSDEAGGTPGPAESYFNEITRLRGNLRAAVQKATDAGLKIPGTGFFDSVGRVLSRASDYTGIPLPDLVTGGPGGVTAVFGTPSGTPVGTKAVPRTAGSTYSGGPMRAGVLTGIPAIDILLSKSSQEGGFFEIPDIEDIGEILRGGGAPAPGQTFTGDTTGEDKKTKFGVNNNRTPTGVDDDKTPTGVDDDKTPTGVDDDKTPTPPGGDLNNGEPGGSDETPAGDDKAAGGEGGGGAGYGQGIGITTGAPGPTVDIDYLYDIAGESIFNPAMGKTEEKDEEKNKRGPYVYANMGGMIRNNYDLTGEILRLLRRK